MTGLLSALAHAPAGRVLFTHDGATITAGEVRAAARRAAARIAPGAGPVFVHADGAALLAAGLLAGASLNRTIAILPHAQPAYLAEVGAGPGSLLIDHAEDGAEPPLALAAGGDAAFAFDDQFDSQLVFFTSGSTGAPKQAPKKMSQIDAEARYWVDWFGTRADHVTGSVSHQHIYGLIFRVAVPVMAGWRSTDRQAFAWESFVTEITPRSVVVTSPAHLTRIPPGLSSARPAFVLSSGQALPLAGALEADALFGAPPLEILGSTETGGVAIRQRRDDAEPWTALGGVTLNLDGEGVLNVGSPFAGGETQRMGDRAEILADGRFRLLARIDRVVKIEGKRVSLARVEGALAAQPAVREVVALAIGSEGAEILAAVVALSPEGAAELANLGAFRFTRLLRKRLSDGLEPAERPKRWRFVEAIPVNSQGKRVLADLTRLFDSAGKD
jgi:acyl-coenzyme A synthetase/AMP-(fatty) acid ligase